MRKIIIQERLNEPSDFDFRIVCWVNAPETREVLYADAAKTSVVKDATPEELEALRSGKVVEFVDKVSLTATATLDDVKAHAQKKYQQFVEQTAKANPGKLFGTYFDGEQWFDGGVQ